MLSLFTQLVRNWAQLDRHTGGRRDRSPWVEAAGVWPWRMICLPPTLFCPTQHLSPGLEDQGAGSMPFPITVASSVRTENKLWVKQGWLLQALWDSKKGRWILWCLNLNIQVHILLISKHSTWRSSRRYQYQPLAIWWLTSIKRVNWMQFK